MLEEAANFNGYTISGSKYEESFSIGLPETNI